MKKQRIYYSIDVECENKDILNFIRLNHPGIKFNYEYVEDVKEEKPDYKEQLMTTFKHENQN